MPKFNAPINVFWYRKPHPGNFGDILTPLILTHYGYQVQHTMPEEADYVMVGSVAKIVLPRHTVLGSGIMSATPVLCKEAKWHWVRGPRTRAAVIANGGECAEIYGDPALLLPRIVKPAAKKRHKIGITPHYVDYEEVKQNYPEHHVINLKNSDPLQVIHEITSCDRIISSSLHGIIAAHAYGIPAAWVKFSGKLAGDDTKFHDYYESLDSVAELSRIESPVFTCPEFNDTEIDSILTSGSFL